jgi:hypothetical protein
MGSVLEVAHQVNDLPRSVERPVKSTPRAEIRPFKRVIVLRGVPARELRRVPNFLRSWRLASQHRPVDQSGHAAK